ncbi:hypothetical protein B0T16DRAFT_412964 [Cercophora newfieldiana]|uniref:Uncharacterized protein n=1 Tax=Cercophora newfieldiana TaxID=92897 RepID=A0AA39Y7F1_9PEZI|nr:hypothetical protein B0T16DRAFT_412964 [Cercophora newfieldiana]
MPSDAHLDEARHSLIMPPGHAQSQSEGATLGSNELLHTASTSKQKQPAPPSVPSRNTSGTMEYGGGSYAVLSFHKTDTVKLLQFPHDIYVNIQPAILASWPAGVQSCGPFTKTPNSYQFKLKGKPFGWMNDHDSVGGARLVRDLLAFLYHQNWEIVMPLSCARRLSAKDMLVFRPRPPSAGLMPLREWLAVCPSRSDKLYIIGDAQPNFDSATTSAVEHTPDHIVWLTMSFTEMLKEMDLLQKSETKYNWIEYKLKGRPWFYGGEAAVKTRLMLLRMFEMLESFGWTSYASVQHRTGNDDKRMVDTMFFSRLKGHAVQNPTPATPRIPSPSANELPSYSSI